MKIFKLSLIMLAVALVSLGLSTTSFAFHSGGVAECEGCHSMHNSFEGEPNVTNRDFSQGTGPYLLKAANQSGSCLNCHNAADTVASGTYHISTDGVKPYDSSSPVEMTPGGDFAWLKKTMSFVLRGKTVTNDGKRHGHNIISTDYGYVADDVLTVAPGGTYPASSLACSSCHDPHGRYRRDSTGAYATTGLPIFGSGSYNSSADPIPNVSAVGAYRILGGSGYLPASMSGSGVPAFGTDPMDVVVASNYNRSEATDQTGIVYGKNVGEWCANCHTGILQGSYTSGMIGLRHPAGNGAKLTAAIVTNYNSYVSSGIMTNSDTSKAFSTLAPFATDTQDRSIMKPQAETGTGGSSKHAAATTGDNVACLSCHRAHASAWESMLRWNYTGGEFLTAYDSATGSAVYADPSKALGYDSNLQTLAYYGRPASAFGPNARSFCNKCHAKD